MADTAITLDTNIKHFEWDFTPLMRHLETNNIQQAFWSTAGNLRMTTILHFVNRQFVNCQFINRQLVNSYVGASVRQLVNKNCQFVN